jgi:lycopene beta-cyclase
MIQRLDYLLVGGGLHNGLIALALAQTQPEAKVGLIERSAEVGGNHTWCLHAADVPAACAKFVEPLIVQRWPRYRVAFPNLERTLEEPYACVTSPSLASAIRRLSRLQLLRGEAVAHVAPHRIELASGVAFEAEVVIDARGPEVSERSQALGFQKFVGLELWVEPHHGLLEPLLMDARVPQRDGFRFLYALPLSGDRVLLEDTYFSDSEALDRPLLRQHVLDFARGLGLRVRRVLREELGALPIPARAPIVAPSAPGLIRAGYQGGWFHPTTGYSFPLALRLANEIAHVPASGASLAVAALARREAGQQRFATALNRLLLQGFAPELRYRALERFYRLPPDTVRRFYALELSRLDRLRILCGRPPGGLSLARLLSARTAARPLARLSGGNT